MSQAPASAGSLLLGDGPPRWRPGERLEAVIATRGQALAAQGRAAHVALDFGSSALSYAALDARANQVARWLRHHGVRPGDRVAHLFERSPASYVSLLGILKAGASVLPLDPATPPDRLAFMAQDAQVAQLLTDAALAPRCAALPHRVLDLADADLAAQPTAPLDLDLPADSEAYLIYTSGTTGRPKGVPIQHSSICSFVRVAGAAYGYRPADRVYQGMTLAFDFSFEEVLVPWVAGATVVPAPPGLLLGDALGAFLQQRAVTAICCVPTLLASVDRDLPELRLLLLGGEATPQDLVARWDRPGRRILNTYGPTEATITCTAGPLVAGRPVTIGAPLPSYAIVILAPGEARLVPPGELGEIGIAGVGLAQGYLNRPEATARAFIPDFIGLPHNPTGRIYRTGDLGRLNADGEIEFHGRIDTQVKLRGYRIELTEVESALLDVPGVAQAVVDARGDELVAWYTQPPGAPPLDRGQTFQALARRLPRYMLPARLERLDAIPLSASNKVDRKALPDPVGPRLVGDAGPGRAPEGPLEAALLTALQRTLDLPGCSPDAHLFDDLGANSLDLARFVTAASPHAPLSIRDCYQYPTVRALAQQLAQRPRPAALAPAAGPQHTPSRWAYLGTALGQLAVGAAAGMGGTWLLVALARWLLQVYGQPALYVRAALVLPTLLAAGLAVSVAGKWLLVGRYRPEAVPLWGARYFRHWLARQLIALNPLAAFRGTPVYNLSLRLLGAPVSLSAVIEARRVPFCTDLFRVGPGAVLRPGAVIPGYRVQGNAMTLGPVDIGAGAYVGEGSVVDLGATLQAGAQLAHASCAARGQMLGPGPHHGSPARPAAAPVAPLPNEGRAVLRGFVYALLLAAPALAALPLLLFIGVTAAQRWALEATVVDWTLRFARDPWPLLPELVGAVSALFVVAHVAALWAAVLWPRLLSLPLSAGRRYRLYGLHHLLYRWARALSNSTYLNLLFGDSVAITGYLRAVGWRLNRVIQTGSNFGTAQQHDSPFLVEIGTGTMASDGLAMITTQQSATHFQLAPARVPGDGFLGNDVRVLPGARLGRNCLVGTKTLVPLHGPLREDTGLLGSPPFEIPRMVDRDAQLLAQLTPTEKAARLRRKSRHNLATALLFLASSWLYAIVALPLAGFLVAGWIWGGPGMWLGVAAVLLGYTVAHFALVERLSTRFRPLPAGMFSTYDPAFWRIERYWKLSSTPLTFLFRGTPLRGALLRLLGARVGRMLFDDGAVITERTLVRLGDHANLSYASTLQSHSLEDGAFKCEALTLGDRCALLPGAFVHYGVHAGHDVVVEPDAFVMKGARPQDSSRWAGNPAAEV